MGALAELRRQCIQRIAAACPRARLRRPVACSASRDRPADPAGGAGHQRRLTRQVEHRKPSSRRLRPVPFHEASISNRTSAGVPAERADRSGAIRLTRPASTRPVADLDDFLDPGSLEKQHTLPPPHHRRHLPDEPALDPDRLADWLRPKDWRRAGPTAGATPPGRAPAPSPGRRAPSAASEKAR